MRWLILIALLVGCQTPKKRVVYFACPTPDLYDFKAGEVPWVKQDILAFERAKEACPKKNLYMPCLIRFVRYDRGDYGAMCGAEREATTWK